VKIVQSGKYAITVMSDKGKRYTYLDWNPYHHECLLRFLKQHQIGAAWRLLRKFPLEEEGTRCIGS